MCNCFQENKKMIAKKVEEEGDKDE